MGISNTWLSKKVNSERMQNPEIVSIIIFPENYDPTDEVK